MSTPPAKTQQAQVNSSQQLDEARLQEFMGKLVNDLGAAASAVMVLVGDRLGLYRALREAGPLAPAELAKRTGTAERYIREWLGNQAASGYVGYDVKNEKYSLSPEQGAALADEGSPVFFAGAFQIVAAMHKAVPTLLKNFKTGAGMDWCQHDPQLFEGTERFFRPGYAANLVQSWIPALEGVEEKLQAGGKVADIGCGFGASTIVMAKAFPKTKFYGFDYHAPSIEAARERAKQAGVADRVTFEVAESTSYPGKDYDLVAHFDCLHDMGDPTGAARHVRQSLAKDGSWMIVEPFAGDNVSDNLNPVGRIYYAASTVICVPASLAHNGPALGAQAGEARLKEVVTKGGFTKFRRATQTPFNLILEAKA
jgi:2-polyprenyl-3-methyl-5-hydroxy-6-metoxy-1,4-benzoquinol methylase